ncbi:MAG: thioredoxin family protein [Thermodesulfobacteriota bacterium]|nr:thioredoxin family protein [Thermodesulfobacteriota bacterium]
MTKFFPYLTIVLSAVLVFACATESQKGPQGPALSSQSDSAEVAAIKEKLDEAFRQVKAGKKNVTIDLNEDPRIAQKGDLIRVDYTVTLEGGALIRTTLDEMAKGATCEKAKSYEEPTSFAPEEILVGTEGSVPGLGDAVLGMAAGEKKSVTLSPEKAYGLRDEDKVVDFPRVKKQAKIVEMGPSEYMARYGTFPLEGAEVNYDAYFDALIMEVAEDLVVLSLFPVEEGPIEDEFGTAVITEGESEMDITLTPKIGGNFYARNQDGRVVASDSDNFTVDFNHPLAGSSVVLDIELVSLTKASTFRATELPWIEDYDEAITAAKPAGKPILLVLYADWCGYSRKLFDRTMEDPRIKVLKERLVWAKIDSDKNPSYKESFAQEGYPMIVVMDSEGLVLEKMSGYRDAKTLREGLEKYIEKTATG